MTWRILISLVATLFPVLVGLLLNGLNRQVMGVFFGSKGPPTPTQGVRRLNTYHNLLQVPITLFVIGLVDWYEAEIRGCPVARYIAITSFLIALLVAIALPFCARVQWLQEPKHRTRLFTYLLIFVLGNFVVLLCL